MFTLRRRLLAAGVAATATALVAATAGVVPASAATVNSSPASLVVYSNNVENRVTCTDPANDFNKLISYMKTQPKTPDLFTVQQISNQADLNALTTKLSDALPGDYKGVIAVASPGSMGYTSSCGKKKNQQTNAVIYRTGRLQLVNHLTWRSDAPSDLSGHPCRNLVVSAAGNSQDRVVNVGVRLRDTVAGKYVNVASFHWPTSKHDGPECADENRAEAEKALGDLGSASLNVLGGDANTTTGSHDWWQHAIDHKFHDPMAEKCGGRVCSTGYDTHYGDDGDGHRIDFMLTKGGHGFSSVDTISFADAGGRYSDHRALTAYVNY